MPAYHLKEVKGAASRRLFHRVPFLIYENDDEFIPHLEHDIENVFNKQLNIILQNGDTRRWVLLDEDNVPVGRIAAFHYTTTNKKIVGGAGFFECINDREAAMQLFQIAENFLKSKNIHTIQAPINCGERDRFWGLLVEGFESPSYLQNYNPPYYKELFEACGYGKDFEQYYYAVDPENFPEQRFAAICDRVMKNKRLSVKHYDDSNPRPFVQAVVNVYNAAWKEQDFYKPLTFEAAENILGSLRLVIEPSLLWVAYMDDKPVGSFLALRELNELFAEFEGSISWWDKILLYFRRKKVPITKVQSFMFGVIPGYRNTGIDAVLIYSMFKALKNFPKLEFMELAWIGDFNPEMLRLMKNLGAKKYKLLYTYTKNI